MTHEELRALVGRQQARLKYQIDYEGVPPNPMRLLRELHAAIEAHECDLERLIAESPRIEIKTHEWPNVAPGHYALVPVPKPVEEGV